MQHLPVPPLGGAPFFSPAPPEMPWPSAAARIEAHDVAVRYGAKTGVSGVNLRIGAHTVMAFIGPSGCGKSTFLRCLNRMNDRVVDCRVEGKVLLDGEDIYASDVDPVELRRRVGMVFQRPNPFPKSIYENVAYGLRIVGGFDKATVDAKVEKALTQAALWGEVKDRLQESALGLSGGQQQRLCIARALVVDPEVLLMDEPASALDPIATAKIEELVLELGRTFTIVIVTHSMQQARRVSNLTAFFHLGRLVEVGPTQSLFESPREEQTRAYLSGQFG